MLLNLHLDFSTYTYTFYGRAFSIELLDAIIDRLKLICADIYAEILLAIVDSIVTDLDGITSGTAKLNESIIVELFIDRIHQ